MELRAASAGPTLHESLLRDTEVTVEAIEALGAVHEERAAEDVAQYVGSSHPLDQRVAAARALGKVMVASTLPALESAVGVSEPEALRVAAACAVLAFGREREAMIVLAEALAKSGQGAEEVEATIEGWLRAGAGRGDERAKKWLGEWTDAGVRAGAARESRARLLREEVLPAVK
jgi:HEAT repeat protein